MRHIASFTAELHFTETLDGCHVSPPPCGTILGIPFPDPSNVTWPFSLSGELVTIGGYHRHPGCGRPGYPREHHVAPINPRGGGVGLGNVGAIRLRTFATVFTGAATAPFDGPMTIS